MKPYSLLLVSWYKPDTPEEILNSNQMLAWGLWTEFSRLSHVSLAYCNSEAPLPNAPKYDIILLHCYLGSPATRKPQLLRKSGKRILGFSEFPTPGADLSFTFLDSGRTDALHVPCPCLAGMLREYTKPKQHNTILLDHPWGPYQKANADADWTQILWKWLWYEEAGNQHEVSQLTRGGHDGVPLPDWIKPIPEATYPIYLEATAKIETFIVTHRGSYEHSVIDMAARGTRVLVPAPSGNPFIPGELVSHLGLETFANREELIALLSQHRPRAPETVLRRCLDMPAVVCMIDGMVQGILRAQELLIL